MFDRLDIAKTGDLLHVTYSGPFSLEGARASIEATASACTTEACTKVLFDCRPMSGEISVLDRFEIGSFGASTIPHGVRIAMLARPDQTLPDRFFEAVAHNRGLTMRVFVEVEEALDWLRS